MTKHDRKRLIKYPLAKPQIGTIDRMELTAYSRSQRPILVARVQRRRPQHIIHKITPLRRNPDKVLLSRVLGDATTLQTFYYRSQPDWFCLAFRGDFIRIPEDYLNVVEEGVKAFKRRDLGGQAKAISKKIRRFAEISTQTRAGILQPEVTTDAELDKRLSRLRRDKAYISPLKRRQTQKKGT